MERSNAVRYYVMYRLFLQEPVKMSGQGSQSNTDALSYIAGSTLRGAIIGAYIRRNCPNYKEDISKDATYAGVLFKDTCFSDAYLLHEGRCTFPTPAIYYADKHEIRKNEMDGEKEELQIHNRMTEVPKEGEQRIDAQRYCFWENNLVHTVSVNKELNTYRTLAKKNSSGKIYHYESILAQQEFYGYISCKNKEDALAYLEVIQDGVLYLGGARGSGYGRCKVCDTRVMAYEDMLDIYGVRRQTSPKLLTIYAMSHLLLADEYGQGTTMIDTRMLEQKLELNHVTLLHSYITTVGTGGFNHTWKTGQIQQTAIKAGSVYVYAYEGELKEHLLGQMEEEGIGLRKKEGFGRVLCNLDMQQTRRVLEQSKKIMTKKVSLAEEEVEVLELMQRHINEKRRTKIIQALALNCTERSQDMMARFSMGQAGKLYQVLNDIQVNPSMKDDEIAKEKIQTFIGEIKNKGKDIYHIGKLNMGGAGKEMIHVIKELIDDDVSFDAWEPTFVKTYQPFLFPENTEYKESEFRLKLAFLSSVLYQHMRKGGGKV